MPKNPVTTGTMRFLTALAEAGDEVVGPRRELLGVCDAVQEPLELGYLLLDELERLLPGVPVLLREHVHVPKLRPQEECVYHPLLPRLRNELLQGVRDAGRGRHHHDLLVLLGLHNLRDSLEGVLGPEARASALYA